jgi:hypothetical protein
MGSIWFYKPKRIIGFPTLKMASFHVLAHQLPFKNNNQLWMGRISNPFGFLVS